MKRIAAAILAVLCLAPAAGEVRAEGVQVSAACAVLMETETGRVLYEKNAHQPGLIASTTKLLTALTALESGHGLDEEVEIRPEYTGAEGSSLYLKEGERLRLETLLYGLLLHSGNDAALAIAGFCGGSAEGFAREMNRVAQELGMKGSHFTNPNGLDQEGHCSTAYDLALLGRACLKNDALRQMVSTRSIHLEGRSFVNHNKLLWQYPGCIGMKTGYTKRAGRTLVSAAEREGTTLIAVTLNDPDDWRDHAALLDWGFSVCRIETAATAGENVARIPVEGSLLPFVPVRTAETLPVAVLKGEELTRRLALDSTAVSAPVRAGDRAGRLEILIDGQTVGEVPLVFGPAEDCRARASGLSARLRELLRAARDARRR